MRKARFAILIAISLLILAGLMSVAWLVLRLPGSSSSDVNYDEEALGAARSLLSAVQRNPNTPPPTDDPDFPSSLWVNDQCWYFLQDMLADSNSEFSLSVLDSYNSSKNPYPWRESVEIWVKVAFSNGKSAQVLYSQGGLAGCREGD